MCEHVDREVSHVFGNAKVAAIHQRTRLRGAPHRDGSARRDADLEHFVRAGFADNGKQVTHQCFVEFDCLRGALEPAQFADRHRGFQPRQLGCGGVFTQNGCFKGGIRIADSRANKEAIQLRFGKRMDAMVLERILGRDDEVRLGQWVCHAVDGDARFGHRFQEC